MNELIVVKQLPVIEQYLQEFTKELDGEIAHIESLEVNEDTVKQVKKLKAEFKKKFDDLETKRKEVKKAILNPYEAFEEIYKKYVSDKYKETDRKIQSKIDEVENTLKAKKEEEVKAYFEEYREANHIDFVNYGQAKIKVGLSDSMKSLKALAKDFIDQRVRDIELIETQKHKEEILVEYKQNLDVSLAITTVVNRFKAIEEEKARQIEVQKQKEAEKQVVEKVEEVVPKEALEAPLAVGIDTGTSESKQVEEYSMKFTIHGTLEQLKRVKSFLESEGIIYE